MKENLTQVSIEPLLSYFECLIPLNKEEKELVTEKFHPRLYRKRQFVLQEGDICTQFNFVVRGCLRMYKIGEQRAIAAWPGKHYFQRPTLLGFTSLISIRWIIS
jgi:CRP-like cAMP-binding protein